MPGGPVDGKQRAERGMAGEDQKIYETSSAEETFALARELGRRMEPGTVVTLTGDLGAGKTVFAQGLAAGLGIEGAVVSPTFTILQEYGGGRLSLYHYDVYRLDEDGAADEMEEIGYRDAFYGEGVCLIEWAERIAELIPDGALRVRIEKEPDRGMDYRRITVR